jgi:autotransporter-associated beta strand protein
MSGGVLQYSSSNTTDYSSRVSTDASQKYNIDTNGQNVTWATSLISSSGLLTKSGSGTLTLEGANTYTGTTTISAGTLKLGNVAALSSSSGGVTVSTSSAAFDLAGFTLTSAPSLTLNGTGISSGGALMNSGAAATYSGLMT